MSTGGPASGSPNNRMTISIVAANTDTKTKTKTSRATTCLVREFASKTFLTFASRAGPNGIMFAIVRLPFGHCHQQVASELPAKKSQRG